MDAPATTPSWTNGKDLKGLNAKHLELIELMIREPTLSNSEYADRLGLTEPWVSTFKHSDLFQEEYAKRLGEHRLLLSDAIIRKTEAVAQLALDRMQGILEDGEQEVGLGRLTQVFDATAKRLFPSQGRGGDTIVNIALASPDAIRKARERADRLRTNTQRMIDVSPITEPAA
jgi:hypothetical protein